jgi:3-dehydroquinate synthase
LITLGLRTGGGENPYHLGHGLLSQIPRLVQEATRARRAFVVSDENVAPLWGQRVADHLDSPLLALPAGEHHKQWPAVEQILRWLLGFGVERQDVLVAVGGGVVTDLVGFAASVALRGIAWVAVPTTVLGMVDAAIGGKTGIDLEAGKNLAGTFWHPRAVVADPAVLASLDERQVRAGLAEVVKAGLIAPGVLTHHLDAHLEDVAQRRREVPAALIAAAVRVKADIVACDEREAGPRAALNLGHTLGHALEAATGYRHFLHGEAVAWGLLEALLLAAHRGLLDAATAQAWARRIELLRPLPPLGDLTWDRVQPFVARDKKRSGGVTGWVLPRSSGVVVGVEVSDAEAAAALARLAALPPGTPFPRLFE